ncbi:filamentous hemagglutinin family protein [Sphingomonas sp. SORGH_AS 879]|nr:filamentous hemagglutinin family protein [Sphingomonas sp. SORGH_AS_0879]
MSAMVVRALGSSWAGERRCGRRRALRALVATALASSALSPALTQTTAPVAVAPVQPANARTGMDVTAGGTPIVNIAKPDANGTSYNVFNRFSVGKEGLVFDNSPTTGNSATSGFLLANPNLVGGKPASLILNEVTGGVRTTIAGPVEIFGGRAALVIANPTGITCDGCGFINTSRVSLAAATLRFGADGTFSGFRIADGGDVTVEGQGLLAGNVDYFDIIAAATHINASLYAKDVVIAGGAGVFDYAGRAISADNGAARTGVAIDSSVLGGMYANRIRLIGTGAGLGINLRGTVAAIDGPLVITSDGDIALGSTTASGDVSLTAVRGTVTLSDLTYAGGALDITGRSIRQGGGFAGALGHVAWRAEDGVTLDGGKGIYAGLDDQGALIGTGALSIGAGGAIGLGNATLASAGVTRIDGGALSQAAAGRMFATDIALGTTGAQSLTGTLSASGSLTLSGGQVVVGGPTTGLTSATARASDHFTIASGGAFRTNGIATLTAPTLDLAGTVLGGAGLALQATGLNASGAVQSGSDLNVTVAGDAALGGNWTANGDATLTVGGAASVSGAMLATKRFGLQGGTIGIGGSVQAGGTLSLQSRGTLITQDGARLLANGAVDIRTAGAIALAGQVSANDTLTIRTAAGLDAGNATLAATHGLLLNAASLHHGQGGQISGAGVTLTTTAGQVLEGAIRSSGDAVLQGDAIDLSGIAEAESGLTLSGRQVLVSGTATGLGAMSARASESLSIMTGGAVQTNGLATIDAPTLALAGTLLGGSGVSVVANGLTGNGLVRSGGDLSATLAGTGSIGGQWTASGDTRLTVVGDLALSGRLLTGKVLTVGAASVTINGDVEAGTTLSLDAVGNLSSGASAKILANGAIGLISDGAVSLAGQVGTNDSLTIRAAGSLDVGTAAITATGALDLSGLSLTQGQGGRISGAGVTLTTTAGQMLGGAIGATGDASLTGDGIDLSGTVGASGALDLSARRLVVSGTASGLGAVGVTAGESLTIRAGGTVETNGVATLASSAFDHAGTVLGVSGVSLRASGLTGNGAVQSGATLTAVVSGDATLGGSWTSKGDATLSVVGDATFTGALVVAKALTFEAGSLSLGGVVQAEGALSLSTIGNLVLGENAQLLANGAVGVTGGVATLAGRLGSNDALSIRANGLLDAGSAAIAATGLLRLEGLSLAQAVGGDIAGNGVTLVAQNGQKLGGTVRSTGDATLSGDVVDLTGTLSANGNLTIAGRRLVVSGTATGLAAAAGTATEGFAIASGGAFQTNGIATLTAPILDLAGTVLGGAGVALQATSLNASGVVQSGGHLNATVAGDAALGGGWSAAGNATFGVGGTGSVSGTILAAKTFHLQAGTVAIDGSVEAGGIASLTSLGALTTSGGARLLANGAVDIRAAGAIALAGQVGANDTLTIRAAGALEAGNAILTATHALDLNGASLHQGQGGQISGAGMTLTTTAGQVLAGAVRSSGNAVLQADTIDMPGIVEADGALTLSGRVLSVSGMATGLGAVSARASESLSIMPGGAVQTNGLATIGAPSLVLAGTLLGGTSVSVVATDLSGSGLVRSGGDLSATLAGTGSIGGQWTASGDTRLTVISDLALSSGLLTGKALTVRAARVTVDGDVEAGTTLSLDAAGDLSSGMAAKILANGAVDLTSGGAVSLAGQVGTNDALTIRAAGALDLGAATITAGGALGLSGLSLLQGQGGTISATGDASLTGDGIDLSGTVGAGGVLGLSARRLVVSGTATGLGAVGVTAGESLTIRAGGTVETNGVATLSSSAFDHAGTILGVGGVSLQASGLTGNGTVQSGGTLTAIVSGDATLGGSWTSKGDAALSVVGDTTLTGMLAVAKALTFEAGSLSLGGVVQAEGAVSLSTVGNLAMDQNAQLLANGPVGVTSGGVATLVGRLGSNDALSIRASGLLDAGSAAIAATGALRLDGLSFRQMVGGDIAGDGVTLVARNAQKLGGKIRSTSYAAVSGDVVDLTGTLSANGDLTVSGRQVVVGGTATGLISATGMATDSFTIASGGAFQTNGIATLTAPTLDLAGMVLGGAGVSLRATNINVTGGIQSGSDLAMTLAGDARLDGSWVADGNLTLGIGGQAVIGGTMSAAKALTVNAAGLTIGGGLQAGGTLSVESQGDLGTSASSQIQANGAIGLTAAGSVSLAGQVGGNGMVGVTGRAIVVPGTVQAIGNLSLSGETLSLTGKVLTAADGTVAMTGAVGIDGTLSAGGNLTLDAAALSTGSTGQLLTTKAFALIASGAFDHRGTLDAASIQALADSIANDGTMAASADLALSANADIIQAGTVQAGRNLTLEGAALTLSGKSYGAVAGGTGTGLTIRSDAIGFNQTSDIQSGGTLDIVGTQGFATLGRIVAMGRAGIHSDGALTQGAVASGNDRFALTAGTTLDQTGTLAAIGRIDLSGAAIRNSGSVTGNDELALDATSALTSTGILQSSGALRLAAPMLTLSGKAITNDVLYLDGTTMTLLGTASGLKGIDARLGDLSLDSAGVLQSGEGFALTLAQLDNAGLIASDKALSVSTSGGFANSGQIAAETALTVAVGGDGVSSGLLQAGGDLDLRIDGAASLSGTLYAGSNATIGAASLRSSAAITSQGAMSLTVGGDAALAAASTTHAKTGMTLSAGTISALGTLQSDAALAFSVGGGLTLGGRTQASGPTRFDIGGAARVDGTLASGGALTLNATAVSIPGRILANDAVSITASSSDLDLTGTIQAVKDVALNAVAWLRIGEATPASAGGSSGSGSGSSSNSSGTGGGSGSGGGGTSSSGGGSGSGGTVGAIAMTLPSLGSSMTYGSLASNGEVALRAANVQINGTVAAKGALSLLADHLLSVQGGAWSDTTLIAQSSEVTLGLLGSMAAAGAVGVTTQGDLVNRGIVASNAGALTMTVGGAFDHRGTLSASTDLRIHTGLDYVASGTVSGGSVAIEARDITLDGRTVGVGGLSVSGRTLTLGEASDIESKAALTLQSRGATSLAGKLLAEGNLTATADSLLSLASTADIQSGGMLKLEAQGDLLTAASSRIVAIGAARVKGDAVTLGGSLAGNAALDLIAASGLTLTGSATALGEVTASASVTNLSGRLASGAGLGLAGGAMVLGGTSTLQALDGLTLSATVLTGNGTIQAGKNLTIASQGGVGLGGTLSAGRVDDQGRMTSLGDLEVTAGGALDLNAAVSATGRTTLVAQGLALGGTLTGLGNLSLDTATLATTGSAKVGGGR